MAFFLDTYAGSPKRGAIRSRSETGEQAVGEHGIKAVRTYHRQRADQIP